MTFAEHVAALTRYRVELADAEDHVALCRARRDMAIEAATEAMTLTEIAEVFGRGRGWAGPIAQRVRDERDYPA